MPALYQPILSRQPEPGHDLKNVLTLQQFIDLLKEEEDYYPGEQHNTRLMITRLRKIFYDQWGWNKELIRGAADIPCRYQVTVVDDPSENAKPLKRYTNNVEDNKHRLVTYRADDRVYGDTRVGQTPFIYKNDHQESLLPDGYYCDLAHILAGLDAHNNPQVVSPFPPFLSFLDKLGPHVDSNMDIVTWLGDIASSSGDFLFAWMRNGKKPLGIADEQHYIDVDAPGSDMLGDIEPYVIARHFDVGSTNGMRYTQILETYYSDDPKYAELRRNRFLIFCNAVGLSGWNGENFSNEKEWLDGYRRQLRDNTSFQVFSLTNEKITSAWNSLLIWFNGFSDVLKLEPLLVLYLDALKQLIKKAS